MFKIIYQIIFMAFIFGIISATSFAKESGTPCSMNENMFNEKLWPELKKGIQVEIIGVASKKSASKKNEILCSKLLQIRLDPWENTFWFRAGNSSLIKITQKQLIERFCPSITCTANEAEVFQILLNPLWEARASKLVEKSNTKSQLLHLSAKEILLDIPKDVLIYEVHL